MRPRPQTLRVLSIALVALLVLAACGGEGDEGPPATQDVGESGSASPDSAPTDESGSGAIGGVIATDEPTLTTDPGTAYAEVDGERIVYESVGSIFYTCEIGSDAIQVNFQTPDGQDLSIQAGRDGDRWSGQVIFTKAGGDIVQYSIVFAQTSGTLGVGGGALSYEGTADRMEDFDLASTQEVDVLITVNCAVAGDGSDPTAVVDGTTYTFPFSGAQSVDCTVSPSELDVVINRLGGEELQLSIDMSGGPEDWLGSVFIITPDGQFIVTLVGAAEGLAIDGNTVTYDGLIESEAGDQVESSVSVTCP